VTCEEREKERGIEGERDRGRGSLGRSSSALSLSFALLGEGGVPLYKEEGTGYQLEGGGFPLLLS